MATYGNVGEFHDGAEEWTAYTERLEHYFTANDIDSAEKKHIYEEVSSRKKGKDLIANQFPESTV